MAFSFHLIGCRGCNNQSFSRNELDRPHLSQKIKWYKIIQPIKNESKGYLFIQTVDEKYDTSRVNSSQISAIISMLQYPDIVYNSGSQSLIILKNILL